MYLRTITPIEIQGVAERWKRQYPDSRDEIYAQLQALPSTATAADVAAIIGNDTWVGVSCSECGTRSQIAVGLNTLEDNQGVVHVCLPCIEKLQIFVKGVREALAHG
jgi:hypothetical protein